MNPMLRETQPASKPPAGPKGRIRFLNYVLGVLDSLEQMVHELDPDDDVSERFDLDPYFQRMHIASDFGLDEVREALHEAAYALGDDGDLAWELLEQAEAGLAEAFDAMVSAGLEQIEENAVPEGLRRKAQPARNPGEPPAQPEKWLPDNYEAWSAYRLEDEGPCQCRHQVATGKSEEEVRAKLSELLIDGKVTVEGPQHDVLMNPAPVEVFVKGQQTCGGD
jgi:hypothetical protein